MIRAGQRDSKGNETGKIETYEISNSQCFETRKRRRMVKKISYWINFVVL